MGDVFTHAVWQAEVDATGGEGVCRGVGRGDG